jgi:DNA processing protein
MTGPSTSYDGDADAWLGLALVEGLSPRKAFDLARVCGGPAAALGASPARLAGAGLPEGMVSALRDGPARAVRERAALGRIGAGVVTWADATYPARLRAIADPPLALFVRGALPAGDEPAVAIVGARRAGEYGRRVAEELARGLAQAGVTVVSGLATGIDAAAHRGTLDGGGRTIAVMATGIDRVYPTWNRVLARDVAACGALVTEFRTGTPPLQFHFPQRNRIIAGLAVGTVVVEAAERSGSLITAAFAAEQGREVFAVPGPIGTPHHAGSHRLIRQGATLVTSADDVLEALAPALRRRLAKARAAAELAALSSGERHVLDQLAHEATHVDAIAARSGLAAADVLETLLALELRRLVDQRPGMRFARRGAA